MKKPIILFLVFFILVLSGNMFANERRGATIGIYRTKSRMEGTPFEKPDIRGELIAVKINSLLILDSESGADITVGIENIEVIKIMKKSKVWRGAVLGLMVGGFSGATLGSSGGGDFAALGALILGTGVGIVGAFIGAIMASSPRIDKTIQIEGKSESEIQEILEKLRKKARVRNFQ
jgi:outer membrane lipoprotein SlyB